MREWCGCNDSVSMANEIGDKEKGEIQRERKLLVFRRIKMGSYRNKRVPPGREKVTAYIPRTCPRYAQLLLLSHALSCPCTDKSKAEGAQGVVTIR